MPDVAGGIGRIPDIARNDVHMNVHDRLPCVLADVDSDVKSRRLVGSPDPLQCGPDHSGLTRAWPRLFNREQPSARVGAAH